MAASKVLSTLNSFTSNSFKSRQIAPFCIDCGPTARYHSVLLVCAQALKRVSGRLGTPQPQLAACASMMGDKEEEDRGDV